MSGTLFVIATPIGHLQDLSLRAIETLKIVDLILAEDTRHSKRLLNAYQINTKMMACHEHNERDQINFIVESLSQGQDMALISDAGTPLISDPGFVLIRALRQAGIQIIPIPGSCALIAALSVSGFPTDRFVFEGFLPAKQQARLTHLQTLVKEPRTLIFYESVHRIRASIEDMASVFSNGRALFLAREMTKTYETYLQGSIESVLQRIKAEPSQEKGEFVVIVHGFEQVAAAGLPSEAITVLGILMAELPLKQAAQLTAKITGCKKNQLYDYALAKYCS